MEDIKKVLKLKQYINPQPLIPKEYYNIINKFKRQFMDQLPPHQDKYNFKIELEPSMTLKFSLLYSISQEELLVIQKYLNKYLKKGFIRLSQSLFASPVLFIKKLEGGLRFYINY